MLPVTLLPLKQALSFLRKPSMLKRPPSNLNNSTKKRPYEYANLKRWSISTATSYKVSMKNSEGERRMLHRYRNGPIPSALERKNKMRDSDSCHERTASFKMVWIPPFVRYEPD